MRQYLEKDDGVRGSYGVLVSLKVLPDGRAVIVFDDVRRHPADRDRWTHHSFFTHLIYEGGGFSELRFSPEELKAVGGTVLVRLNALSEILGSEDDDA